MTKKVLSLLLCLILSFSLFACADKKGEKNVSSSITSYEISQNESVPSKSDSQQTSKPNVTSDKEEDKPSSKPETSSTSSQQKEPQAPDISKISCRKASEIKWQRIRVTLKSVKTSFEFDIPSDWSLNKLSGGGFEILRSGKKIGTLLAEDTSAGESLKADYTNSKDYSASIYSYVKWDSNVNKGQPYRYVALSTFPQSTNTELHILFNYSELDNTAIETISDKVSVYQAESEFIPLSQTNGSKKILILGNSFVNSSMIGSFLSAMLTAANSEYSVRAISLNGANVKTFADRSDIMNEIRNGEYCYVFQCGFYSSIAVSAFSTIKENCKVSGTIPVIFPAHNENAAGVSNAKGQYGDTIFLDWQGEIETFIKTGIDRFDFCYDDGNDHSKPLAGYVGAHMIYRSLFNEVPPAQISSPMSMESIRSYLGDYIETGIVPNSKTRPAFTGKKYVIN